MTTIYITQTEAGYELEDSNEVPQGTAETLDQAIESARQFVELGLADAWVINE